MIMSTFINDNCYNTVLSLSDTISPRSSCEQAEITAFLHNGEIGTYYVRHDSQLLIKPDYNLPSLEMIYCFHAM